MSVTQRVNEPNDRYRAILETAAGVIFAKGYKGFRPDGELTGDQPAKDMIELLFTGLEPRKAGR
jgi:hypothetical protein